MASATAQNLVDADETRELSGELAVRLGGELEPP